MIFETIRYEEELHEAADIFAGVKDAEPEPEPMQLALQLIKAKTAPSAPEATVTPAASTAPA